MNSILPGIFFSPWQEIIMTLKVDFFGGNLIEEFGLPALISSVIRPNQYRDLIRAEIDKLNQSNPTSNYIFDVKIAANFIKVWLCQKTTKQQRSCILNIYQKRKYTQNPYNGKEEKTLILVVEIVHKDNSIVLVEFNTWQEVYNNLSTYIPTLIEHF
jgi:hypothetical protein